MSASGSSLASVIGFHPEDLAEWNSKMTRSDRPLALLHKQFWGKGMADEEREWHSARESISARGDGDRGNAQDVDESMESESEDDIIPGCYVLRMDIPGIEYESIWIRAEYIRIYDYFEKFYTDVTGVRDKPPAAVLTGQPGIGKSVWIFYALRRCLAERRPVIWYYQGTCYLFVDEGVYAKPADFPPGYFKTIVWTLVDSDENKEGVPTHLIPHGTRLFIIYVTSPAKEKWSRMDKTVLPSVVVMNPWTRNEIHRVAPLRHSSPNFKLINDTYDRLGPTPRLCFDKAFTPRVLQSYKHEVDRALKHLTLEKFEAFVHGNEDLAMDVLPMIFLVRRADPVEIESPEICLTPVTDYVKSKLAIHFRNFERQELIQFYESLCAVPSTRPMSSCIFEAYCQRRFQTRISIKFVPMVRHSGDDQKCRPQWHASHFVLPHKELERKRRAALHNIATLKVRPSDIRHYRDDDLEGHEVIPQVYYVPKTVNEIALDSFIIHDGHLYIFQFPCSNSHVINGGLISLLAKCTQLPTPNSWCFILVIPEETETLKCSVPQTAELQGLKLFSSMIAITTPKLQIPGYSEI